MARTERQDNAATDLNEWWREVTPLLTGVLPRQVKLEPAIFDNLPPVQIGRVELTQAIFNLAHNASRALRDTDPAILKIGAVPCADGQTICVRLTDNGEGMAQVNPAGKAVGGAPVIAGRAPPQLPVTRQPRFR